MNRQSGSCRVRIDVYHWHVGRNLQTLETGRSDAESCLLITYFRPKYPLAFYEILWMVAKSCTMVETLLIMGCINPLSTGDSDFATTVLLQNAAGKGKCQAITTWAGPSTCYVQGWCKQNPPARDLFYKRLKKLPSDKWITPIHPHNLGKTHGRKHVQWCEIQIFDTFWWSNHLKYPILAE